MRRCCLALLLIFISQALFSANILVPKLELITRGYVEGTGLLLGTQGSMEFLIAGGFKFGGRILLGFESEDLENLESDRSIKFQGAQVVIINPFELPLELSYFTGENDTFGNGDVFPFYYGADPIASRFRGFLYFPEETQTQYDGIHTISGTGIKIASDFQSDSFRLTLYTYQDQYLGSGNYSADVYASLNLPNFKLESYAGYSYLSTVDSYFRAGIMLFYDTGLGGEFLTQVGMPVWDINDPGASTLPIGLFYFLFEPRVRFGLFSIILTFFLHPQYYFEDKTGEDPPTVQQLLDIKSYYDTGEEGSADINANFAFGDPELSPMSGGIEARLGTRFSPSSEPDNQLPAFTAKISPYLSVLASGVIWDFKIDVKLLPFDLADIVEGFIGVRAEF